MRPTRIEGVLVRDDGYLQRVSGELTKGSLTKSGYFTFSHKRRVYRVHRLVAEAFVPNPRPDIFKIVDHIDRNRLNNSASNLRWISRSLNTKNITGECVFQNHKKFQVSIAGVYYGTFADRGEAVRFAKAKKLEMFNAAYKEALLAEPRTKSVGVQCELIKR